jgi:hypothetical protein
VADYKNHSSLWLEKELARQLAPVSAPDSLWDRINQPRRARRQGIGFEWAFWPAATAMVLLAFAGVLRTRTAHPDSGRITEQESALLTSGFGRLDLRSDSFEETRAWVKSHAGLDIEIPPESADRGAVRLLGARLIRFRGLPVAAIDYVAGDQTATLLVAGRDVAWAGDARSPRHVLSPEESTGGVRIVSWNSRNQSYAIAFSSARNSHGACLLCHANTPGLIVGFPGIH